MAVSHIFIDTPNEGSPQTHQWPIILCKKPQILHGIIYQADSHIDLTIVPLADIISPIAMTFPLSDSCSS